MYVCPSGSGGPPKEAKGGGAAESQGWASTEHGFGYEKRIPQTRTLGYFAFWKNQTY
jgi:hypothetical protein